MLLISPATLWPLEDRTVPSSGSLPNMWHMTWPMVLLIRSEQPSSCHSTHLLCGRHLAFFLFYEYRKLILAAEPFHLWFPLLGIPHSRSSRGQLFVILASAHVQPLTEAFPDTHIKIIPYHFYQSYISMSPWVISSEQSSVFESAPFQFFGYVLRICLPQLDYNFLEGRYLLCLILHCINSVSHIEGAPKIVVAWLNEGMNIWGHYLLPLALLCPFSLVAIWCPCLDMFLAPCHFCPRCAAMCIVLEEVTYSH